MNYLNRRGGDVQQMYIRTKRYTTEKEKKEIYPKNKI